MRNTLKKDSKVKDLSVHEVMLLLDAVSLLIPHLKPETSTEVKEAVLTVAHSYIEKGVKNG